ncbi:MAG: hypothetical protein QF441_05195 [Bacteriovoracaceae bacterium]|jgi:Mrp family chromosome partitioning ATPase|nr:hypothetical protein [Halobacteriovoraceae bacterium]MDP7319980.1 hypothetical protein [Bacteriovoracaceae bacterium]|tara:strand:- start:97 stop:678 length:582 start_codon:yes stop_codon:yes gene_type:complete
MNIEQSGSTQVADIVKNFDYQLRVSDAKVVGIFSDAAGEGKSFALTQLLPHLCDVYKRKTLVVDLTNKPCEILAKAFGVESKARSETQSLEISTRFKNINYVTNDELLIFSKSSLDNYTKINRFIKKCRDDYDLIIVNTSTLKRSKNTIFPEVSLDAAVLVRSKRSLGKNGVILKEILDRDIDLLGIIYNEGV